MVIYRRPVLKWCFAMNLVIACFQYNWLSLICLWFVTLFVHDLYASPVLPITGSQKNQFLM